MSEYAEVRELSFDGMLGWLDEITDRVAEFAPSEIVPIARSGFIYGAWVAQKLALPVGAYWPDRQILVIRPETKRVVFVDDNTLSGATYLAIKKFMAENHPDVEFKLAVLFSDHKTPREVLDEIITAEVADYYIASPFPGQMKVCTPNVRFRDE